MSRMSFSIFCKHYRNKINVNSNDRSARHAQIYFFQAAYFLCCISLFEILLHDSLKSLINYLYLINKNGLF